MLKTKNGKPSDIILELIDDKTNEVIFKSLDGSVKEAEKWLEENKMERSEKTCTINIRKREAGEK